MNKKVLIVTLLIIVLSFGSVYANTTQEQAAKDLNEIQVIKGDGKDLNLEGELTRAEGATFIVRLLGVEDEVITNKIDYLALDFSDVYGTDWFSPYVGYCVEKGIIDGYSDGTFRALDKLSEQAFVKMVLGAMGYEHGVDFKWSETFSFAYDNGILTDESYKDMVSNTNPYTRGSVVELLHHVLSQTDATGDKVMVDTLVESNVLTREEAITYGFINDPLIMEVNDFKQNNGKSFTVLFNENPKVLTPKNIIVKEKYTDKTIEVSKVFVADIDRMYYINVDNQIPDKEYVMTLKDVEDLQGNVLDAYTFEFFGFRDSDYESAYYRIARAELKSMNLLDVTFTHPVDIDGIRTSDITIKLNKSSFIEGTDRNLSLEVDESNPYVLHIEFLNFDFTFEETFELVVSENAESLYGAAIKGGREDSARFTSIAYEEEDFALDETILESDKSLILVFNKNINTLIAEQIYSYYITKGDATLKILEAEVIKSGSNANKAVRLTMEDKMVANGAYSLLINQVYDTTRSERIIEERVEIVAKVISKPSLEIISAKTTDGNRIEVVVDQYLDESQAVLVNNYSVVDSQTGTISRRPSKVYYDKYASVPTLVLEFVSETLFTDGMSYKVVIDSDMKLDSGLSLKSDAKKTFVDNKSSYSNGVIKKAMYIGNDIILIKGYSEFAVDTPNVSNNNYELQYLENEIVKTMEPIGVVYFNEHAILLRFEDLDDLGDYSLKVNQIKTGFGETIDISDSLIKVIIEEIQ